MEVGSQTDWDLHHKKKEAFSELNQQRFFSTMCHTLHTLHTYPATAHIPSNPHTYPATRTHTQHTAHIMSTFLPKKAFTTGLKVHITVHTVHSEPTVPTEPRDPRDRTPIIAPDFWDVVEAELGMDMDMDMDIPMPMSTEELVELEEYMDELEIYLN